MSLRLVTKSREGEEDKGGVFTAATLRSEQEGDVCPVRHLERPSVPIIDRARVLGDRGLWNGRWWVDHALAGRPQLEAD